MIINPYKMPWMGQDRIGQFNVMLKTTTPHQVEVVVYMFETPMDSLAVWAPEDGGPQLELQIDMMSAGDQQMEAA